MARNALTYQSLRDQTSKSIRLASFTSKTCLIYNGFGLGGFVMFLLVMHMPPVALAWLASVLGLSGWTAWQSAKDHNQKDARENIVRAIIEKQFPLTNLSDTTKHLHGFVRQGVSTFSEIAIKISELTITQGESRNFAEIFTDAENMVSLQFESVRMVETFSRAVYLVTHNRRTHDTNPLLTENIQRIEAEITAAESRIEKISSDLDIMMLQLTQIELQPTDHIQIDGLMKNSSKRVQELELEIQAQRSTAAELMPLLST